MHGIIIFPDSFSQSKSIGESYLNPQIRSGQYWNEWEAQRNNGREETRGYKPDCGIVEVASNVLHLPGGSAISSTSVEGRKESDTTKFIGEIESKTRR